MVPLFFVHIRVVFAGAEKRSLSYLCYKPTGVNQKDERERRERTDPQKVKVIIMKKKPISIAMAFRAVFLVFILPMRRSVWRSKDKTEVDSQLSCVKK